MTLQLLPLAHSEIGLVRKDNQDSAYVSTTMLLVADGMGGAAAGDVASAVAVAELAGADTAPGPHPLDALRAGIARADDVIAAIQEETPDCEGMGTTVTGGLFDGRNLAIVHIGDSRGYLLRRGKLTRLTHDHSYVQSLIDEGKVNESEARSHPHRSLLLRVLNGQRYTTPEYFMTRLEPGDRVMFCSDGLSGLVDDTVIRAYLMLPNPREAMTALIAAAHNASGSDNITIVLGDVVDSDAPPPAEASPDTEPEANAPEPTVVADTPAPDTTPPPQVPLPLDDYVTSGVLGAAANPRVTAHIPTLPTARTRLPRSTRRAKSGGNDQGKRPDKSHDKKRGRVGVIIVLLAIIVVLLGAGWGVYAYGASQFFVADAGGHVAIYQGVAGNVLGLRTNRVYETTSIALTNLPYSYRDRVTAGIRISSGGLTGARTTVNALQVISAQCLVTRAQAGGVIGADGC